MRATEVRMSTHVLVHIDLSPEENRADFYERLEDAGWLKIPRVFTAWRAVYRSDDAGAVRGSVIDEIRKLARLASVRFVATVMAGNTEPEVFRPLPLLLLRPRA